MRRHIRPEGIYELRMDEDIANDLLDQDALDRTGPTGDINATPNWRQTVINRMVSRRTCHKFYALRGNIRNLYHDEWLQVREQLVPLYTQEV